MGILPLSSPYRSLCIVAIATLVVGCASWREPATLDSMVNSKLTPLHEHKKHVVLDVEFVNLAVDSSDADQAASLWQWVDETEIDPGVRQRLIANGIRVGIVSSEERFRDRLAAAATNRDVIDQFLSQASVASDVSRGDKRIPMRIGRRYELPLRQPIEGSHVAMVRVDGETRGRTLNNAQYLLAITAIESIGRQQVRLRFRPEIQHGETRQKWVSSDSAIRIDMRRETWSLPSLDLNLAASEGDLIVIAPTTPLTGLAKQMLTGTTADHNQEQVVLLVRVAQVPSAIDQL